MGLAGHDTKLLALINHRTLVLASTKRIWDACTGSRTRYVVATVYRGANTRRHCTTTALSTVSVPLDTVAIQYERLINLMCYICGSRQQYCCNFCVTWTPDKIVHLRWSQDSFPPPSFQIPSDVYRPTVSVTSFWRVSGKELVGWNWVN